MERISLLTKHDKSSAIQPALTSCDFLVNTIDHYDTDQLGTFTNEQKRIKSQQDTALYKAQLGAQLGNTRYGLGSEGSFGPDPFLGMTPWNIEVLAWWDATEQHAVYAVMQGPETNYAQKSVRYVSEALQFLGRSKFPAHGVIVGKPGESCFNKDIDDTAKMEALLQNSLQHGAQVWLETDMRAHRNPTRMRMIERCAKRLAAHLRCLCPACSRPGYVATSHIAGAICESCGNATSVTRAEIFSCSACAHHEQRVLPGLAPSSRCDHCNP